MLLTAKSRLFVDTFNERCAIVLGRNRTKTLGPNDDGHFISKYSSIDFLRWWYHQDLSTLTPLITFPIDYLHGRFDSDGYVQKWETGLCGASGHEALLRFDRQLCAALGMRVGFITKVGPRPGQAYRILGREVKIRQQGLRFYVNPRDFAEVLGSFSDEYKHDELVQTLRSYRGRSWTAWTEAIWIEANLMHDKYGLDATEIARNLSSKYSVRLPRATVYSWFHRGASSFEAYNLRRPRNLASN